jgi:hypothetical protein
MANSTPYQRARHGFSPLVGLPRRCRHYSFPAPHLLALLMCFTLQAQSRAAAPGDDTTGIAVKQGLQFLQKEAFAWKETRKCAACHHAATMIWTFNEAKVAGYRVDEKALKEVIDWAFGEVTNSLAIQPPPRDVVNLGWVYTLLAMETIPQFSVRPLGVPAKLPDSETLSGTNADGIQPARCIFIERIIDKQASDGSWGKPLDERVPLGGPVEDIAVLCRLALLQTGDQSTSVVHCLAKAANWLAANRDKTSRQGRNLRLLMNLREGKSAGELTHAIDAITAEQNADGGWSQTPELASDAYATGQTLYVLARAGIKPGATIMRRGVDFLTRTQHEDGSWPMLSRVNAKNLNPITAAGTAWAVLGLIRSSQNAGQRIGLGNESLAR